MIVYKIQTVASFVTVFVVGVLVAAIATVAAIAATVAMIVMAVMPAMTVIVAVVVVFDFEVNAGSKALVNDLYFAFEYYGSDSFAL